MDVYMIICASLCILIFSVMLWSDIRRVIKIRERRKEIQECDKDGLSAEYNIFPLSESHYYNFKEKQNMDGWRHLYGAIIGAVAIVAVIILGEYVAVVVPVLIILSYLEAAKSYKMLTIGSNEGLFIEKCELCDTLSLGNNMEAKYVIFYDHVMKEFRNKRIDTFGRLEIERDDEIYIVVKYETRKMKTYGLCLKKGDITTWL